MPFRKYFELFLRKSKNIKGVDDLQLVTLKVVAAQDRLRADREAVYTKLNINLRKLKELLM